MERRGLCGAQGSVRSGTPYPSSPVANEMQRALARRPLRMDIPRQYRNARWFRKLLITVHRSMVIDWLESQHQSTHAAVIYLYCSYKEEEAQTPQNMIGSLLKQVVQHRATLPADVRALYNKHLQKKTYPKLDELARLLVQEVNAYSRIFVVVDALDECPERGNIRGRLLAEIQKLPQNARILITSRYSPKIEERFENFPHIDIRATDEDVKRYIEARIEKEKSLARHVRSNQALMEEITKTVVESCQGMCVLSSHRFLCSNIVSC